MDLLLPDDIKKNNSGKNVKSFTYTLKRKGSNGEYIVNDSKIYNKSGELIDYNTILQDNLPIEDSKYTYNTYYDGIDINNSNKIGIVVVKKIYIEAQNPFSNISVFVIFDQDFKKDDNSIIKYESLDTYIDDISKNVIDDNLLKDYVEKNEKIYLNNIYKKVIENLIKDYKEGNLNMIKIILCPQNDLCYSYKNIEETINNKTNIKFAGLEYIEQLLTKK